MRKRILLAVAFALAFLALLLTVINAVIVARRAHREELYIDTILTAAELYEVPPSLVLAVIRTESDFKKDALSHAGAVGLMQLMPETFAYVRDECLKETLDDDAIFDPAVNIRYGTYYLSYLLDRFQNIESALAAYNAGEGNVTEWLEDMRFSENGQLTNIPFPETAAYVKRVVSARESYQRKYKLS